MNNKQKKNYIKELIVIAEREMVQNEVQAWVFGKEIENPIHIGLEHARTSKDIYDKRIQYLKEIIEAYNQYLDTL